MWGPDVPVVPPPTALRQVTLVTLALISFGFFIKYALVPEPPAVRRQYPYSGLIAELGGLEENKVRFTRFRSSYLDLSACCQARPEDEGEDD